jgi:murein DD-endopeptidase MepM/ murein hydrolase activator NlpD
MIMLRLFLLLLLLTIPWPCLATLKISGSLTQGGLIRGQVPAGTRVFYGDQQLKVTAEGHFILGFGRDAAPQQSLTLIETDGLVVTEVLQLTTREYQIERIDGISKRMMAPSADDLKRIRSEAEQAKLARQADSNLRHFLEPFDWPVVGRISGVYGSQRFFNGEPRRPHFGIDIAVPTGTPVLAPAGGRVTLAHQGMFFSGKTLIIDHGHGLSSSFLHLHRILVAAGEQVKKGQQIATVGATGRVTGPHLDWRINWFAERLDPSLLVPAMSPPAKN